MEVTRVTRLWDMSYLVVRRKVKNVAPAGFGDTKEAAMAGSRGRLAVVGLVAALTVGGCTSAAEPEAARSPSADPEVTVLQPGRPGEAAETVSPDDAPGGQAWNHSDVAFVQMMIPHHAQALEMSRLAQRRAADDGVRAMAERIRGAQGPEIVAMAAWLDARGMEVPKAGEDADDYDHGVHGHVDMAGMLTAEQMEELEAARGKRFDRLFLQGMIAHHRGAVEMAEATAAEGADVQVLEMSADVSAGQMAEIDRMEQLLRRL